MSRWIEVEPLIDKAKEYGGYYEDTVYAVPLADIEEAPSIDLVRCAECEKSEDCEQIVVFDNGERITLGYNLDFCSHGKRKESE